MQVVTPDQARKIYAALKQKGLHVPVARVLYLRDASGNTNLVLVGMVDVILSDVSQPDQVVYGALELRDGGSEYLGKGVSKLGANVILAVSLAVCKAGASVLDIPLYMHIDNLAGNKNLVLQVHAFNVINGGSHAGNKLAMQLMILPVGAKSFKEAMKMGVEVYHNLKSVIKKKYGQDATNVGDECGFAPNIQENKEGLELLKTAIAKAGYPKEVVIGMDVAASEFYDQTKAMT
ncbi:hypothetical protein MKW92_009362 [Papaver armeniacum]|nr:hypothetical protein MKW92_009362 [Papaver armeniacum]